MTTAKAKRAILAAIGGFVATVVVFWYFGLVTAMATPVDFVALTSASLWFAPIAAVGAGAISVIGDTP